MIEIVSQILIVGFMILLGFLVFKYTKFEMKTTTITVAAMLIVVAVILGTSYFTIPLPVLGPNSFEIKFDTLPIMFTGILFGPAWGFIAGLMTDLLQLLISPVSFPYFGFTLNLVLTGVISGLIFSKRNKLSSKIMEMLTQIFVAVLAVMAILYVGLSDTIVMSSSVFELNFAMKVLIGLVLFVVAGIIIFYLYWMNRQVSDESEKEFLARFSLTVVLCEMFVQMILTSLWLSILFKLPWIVYMAPRVVEAVFMIFITIFVGQLLYRLIFSRLITKYKE